MTVLAGPDGGDAGDFPEVDGVLLLLRVAPGLPTEAVPLHPSDGALLPPPISLTTGRMLQFLVVLAAANEGPLAWPSLHLICSEMSHVCSGGPRSLSGAASAGLPLH